MTRETRDESSLPPSASSSSSSLPFALARFPGAKNRGLKSASSLREGSIVFQSVPYSAVLRDAGLHERDHFTFELPTTKSTTSSVSQLQRCSATKFARYFLSRESVERLGGWIQRRNESVEKLSIESAERDGETGE